MLVRSRKVHACALAVALALSAASALAQQAVKQEKSAKTPKSSPQALKIAPKTGALKISPAEKQSLNPQPLPPGGAGGMNR